MKSAFFPVLGAVIAVAISGAAAAQAALQQAPSAASAPQPAASKPFQTRSPAVRAAENANESGMQGPEQRAIPQLSMPLKSGSKSSAVAPAASLPAGSVPGTVNDGAARCVATGGAKERAACERGLPASGA